MGSSELFGDPIAAFVDIFLDGRPLYDSLSQGRLQQKAQAHRAKTL